ncbi:hypothetical protein Bbelb_285920 [Branchiostoma belcheri]|nr:hypothetical protein Bbelb_285920 [Branchiostoma belcheri]
MPRSAVPGRGHECRRLAGVDGATPNSAASLTFKQTLQRQGKQYSRLLTWAVFASEGSRTYSAVSTNLRPTVATSAALLAKRPGGGYLLATYGDYISETPSLMTDKHGKLRHTCTLPALSERNNIASSTVADRMANTSDRYNLHSVQRLKCGWLVVANLYQASGGDWKE